MRISDWSSDVCSSDLPDGLESQDFVNDVGAKYMKDVHGTAAGSVKTPSLDTFKSEFKAKFGQLPTQAYIPNAYDGAIIVGLAMEYAKSDDATAIRDGIRKETGRAACRERVCQYVSISVVGVS